MQRYNFIQGLYLAFFSPDFYRDVVKNWGAKSFLFLMMIMALSWIYFTYQAQVAMNLHFKEKGDQFASQIPILHIKNGKMSTPENRPYLVRNPSTNELFAIIDTSGKYQSLDHTQAVILFTENKITYTDDENETRTINIPSTINTIIYPQTIKSNIAYYLQFLWLPLFIILFIFSYLYRVFQALVYALIGKVFTKHLIFTDILYIAIVALTPTIIITTVADAFGVAFKFQFLVYFAISIFYLFFGIRANKSTIVQR